MIQPVLIVGAGPVGLTLASELKRYGVDVRIVDKAATRTDKSKAMVLWSRTLELLDRGGAGGSAPFVEAGFKIAGVTFVAGGRSEPQLCFVEGSMIPRPNCTTFRQSSISPCDTNARL